MKKTTSATTITVIKPEEILRRHLLPALKPYATKLREAAELDSRLSETMAEIHPDKIKREAEELFEAAAAGDESAEKFLAAQGGKSGMIRDRSAMFCLARTKHEHACKASAPLWKSVAEATETALDLAGHDIGLQLKTVLEELGELPSSTASLWEAKIRGLKVGLGRAEFLAVNANHGVSWQMQALGLSELIEG
jgi:hypothetical protein